MSQKTTSDSSQKGFAVGRGLLAAAEALNFSMGESLAPSFGSSTQQHFGMMGLGGGNSQDRDSHLPSQRLGNPLSNTMKLFASLGLSPGDINVLTQIPEENISVETLPQLIKQLKNRKPDAGRPLGLDLSQSLYTDFSYRGGRDEWGDVQGGRLDRSTTSASHGDFGYSFPQDVSTRGYDMRDCSSIRDRQYSDLSTDDYRGSGMPSSTSDDLFMQHRIGAPSQGKIQDFLGVMPLMFPHVCSLCDFDVHSIMEWTLHTVGMEHVANRRVLLQLYPDWDPHMPYGLMSDSLMGRGSDGLLGPAPLGARASGDMSSSGGFDLDMASNMSSYSETPKIRGRVVVVKYDKKPSLNDLFNLASPFGTICEKLVFNKKAFLEFQTHEEALAMANYYQYQPAILHGNEVRIYLSKQLFVIEKKERPDRESLKQVTGPVVLFSNLPSETKKKSKLLAIARRFGTIVNHLFLAHEAFIQMSSPEEAEKLVKYYTAQPLTLADKSIKLNISIKYKTLTVVPGRGEQIKEDKEASGHQQSSKASSSPKKNTSSKSKESMAEVTEDKEEGEVVSGEESDNEEGSGTEDKKAVGKELAEESVNEQLYEERMMECEDSAVEKSEGETQDAEGDEVPQKEDVTQEFQSEELAEPEEDGDRENNSELKETDEKDDTEQDETVPEEFGEQEELKESVIPENVDEFVTLDELAEEEKADSTSRDKTSSSGKSRTHRGMRVVNIVGFRRGIDYVEEILALAKPFGKVVEHLVLNSMPGAFLELRNEQEARAMVRFYNSNGMPSVCGKSVKIFHSMAYATIQTGKVICIGDIPPIKSGDASILKIVEPYGKIRRYNFNRERTECFVEMVRSEAAKKFVEDGKLEPHRFKGKRLRVYVTGRNGRLLNGHRPPSPEDKRPAKREHSDEEQDSQTSSSRKSSSKHKEPPTKKQKEDNPSVETGGSVPQEEKQEKKRAAKEKEVSTKEHSNDSGDAENVEAKPKAEQEDLASDMPSTSEKDQVKSETLSTPDRRVKRPETSLDNLGPYEPNVPVGVEFVKMGYYCRVCFMFYSNEDTIKKVHCSSQGHYEKLKKHLEKKKKKAKAQSNDEKN